MIAKVDWFQFALPVAVLHEDGEPFKASSIMQVLRRELPELSQWEDFNQEIVPSSAPFPYAYQLEVWQGAFYVLWGTIQPCPLLRFTGVGCDRLREMAALLPLSKRFSANVSRIDFAVDMETDCTPAEFVTKRPAGRVLTKGSYISPQGLTEYLGSRQSDFYARVYRYAPPHPRSNMLRAEIEVKGAAARSCSLILALQGQEQSCMAVHERYHWGHPCWTPTLLSEPVSMARNTDKVGRGELFWLEKQVLPALIRYHREGLLDVRAWFEDHVIGSLPGLSNQ